MTRASRLALAVTLVALALPACRSTAPSGKVVRVYSGRQYGVEKAFNRFSKQTGISVEFLFGSDAELRERIRAEGKNTKADVYLTVDAGNLYLAARQGVFRPLRSAGLDQAVPASFRDPGDRWYGLSLRARTIVYNPNKVQPSELSTYQALTDPKWKGRLCMRDSSNVYTQSLVAGLIADDGYARAVQTLKGWVANGVQILASDVLVLDTVAKGGCDVGIANHYYLAQTLARTPTFPVKLFWADQQGRGVNVNISGAGVTRNADNPDLGRRLIEWLATDGQKSFVDGNYEYPVNPRVKPDPLLIREFGANFKKDSLDAAKLGSLNADAIRAMDEAGYE